MGLAGDAQGDAVQPGGQRRGVVQPGSLAGQQEERSLEGVLGVGGARQHAAADAQDHRPVAGDQRREGVLVAVADEAAEQLGIGGRPACRRRQATEVAGECGVGRHGGCP